MGEPFSKKGPPQNAFSANEKHRLTENQSEIIEPPSEGTGPRRPMNQPTTFQARYIFPVNTPPLRDATVTISDGRIVAVNESVSGAEVRDLGNAAVLPGLVNAHTHLEFSDLDAPLGKPGMAMPDWIREVIAYRRRQRREPTTAIRRGLDECARCGTTTIGEIVTPGWLPEELDDSPVEATIFMELIALSMQRTESLMELAGEHVQSGLASDGAWRPGISPHAPYTTRPELIEQTVQMSRDRRVPVAMHLAESWEELELLASQCGEMLDLLMELEVWDPTAVPRGIRPLDYLQTLSQAHRVLVIHGNFLDDEEVGFLAEHPDNMSLVYCPRTHAYFHGNGYPLAERLAAGVRMALGTDSRASNPDLSLLEEMRFVARHHPDVSPKDIVRLGTLGGAEALGRVSEIGTLEVGKAANLAVVSLPEGDADDPHELLFDSDLPVAGTSESFTMGDWRR